MIKWRPMDSAPKKGKKVLLLLEYGNIAYGYLHEWSHFQWKQVDENTKTKIKIDKSGWRDNRARNIDLKPIGWISVAELLKERDALDGNDIVAMVDTYIIPF